MQLSQRVRVEAARGVYVIPACKANDEPCVKGAVVAIRRSELRKSRALQDAVRAVDRAKTKGKK